MSDVNLYDAHHQWATRPADQRFDNLGALQAQLRARSNASREVGDVTAARLVPFVDGAGDVAVNLVDAAEQTTPLAMTHWSMGQVSRVAGAPSDYLRSLPAELAVECLAEGLKADFRGMSSPTAKLLVRSGDEADTLAALTSGSYGRIFDHQVADAVAELVRRDERWHNPLAYDRATGASVPSGLYASDRDVFVFMIDGGSLLEAGPRAQLHRGFFASNSETGARSFRLVTFLFNVVCGNHIVWGAEDVREVVIRHSLYAPEHFASEAGPTLLAYANASAAPVEQAVRAAVDYLLPAPAADLNAWFTARGFTKAETRHAIDYAKREEGDCRTLWHAVQGLTAYGRDLAFADARVDIQTRAGKLLDLVKVSA